MDTVVGAVPVRCRCGAEPSWSRCGLAAGWQPVGSRCGAGGQPVGSRCKCERGVSGYGESVAGESVT